MALLSAILAVTALSLSSSAAFAAAMTASPAQPQPGDVITLTVRPAAGESITAVRMSAFDTPDVKFFSRPDGSYRAFLGFPFDRKGGLDTLSAAVSLASASGGTAESPAGGTQASGTPEHVSVTIHARSRQFPTQHIKMALGEAKTMGRRDALHREKELVESHMQNTSPTPLWKGSWIVPARGVSTSSYGRMRYVNGHWWGQHNGADIRAAAGTRVVAANSGRVVLSAYLPTLRGNCIIIDHGCNVYSVYMHLSRRLVEEGASVTRGEAIGQVGATGFVTGPHLHWEVRIGWEPVDPFHVVYRPLQF